MSKPLVIILITYERTQYALKTIDSVFRNLITPHGYSWYICDDGSSQEHHEKVRARIREHGGHICGHHNQKLGYGGGVNKAWPIASQTGPITLWLEDDWELEIPWDMGPYIEVLNTVGSVGMIRLGHLPLGQRGEVVGYLHNRYLEIDPAPPFQFSGNPHLKHDRFMLHYGKYPTGLHPGGTESHYDRIVRNGRNKGPSIIWPLFIGDRHLWGHIGTVHSYEKT